MWSVIGASEAGASHAATNKQCEDAFDWRLRADGTLLIAVADGAGSAANALDGATYVTRKAIDWIDVELDRTTPTTVEAIEQAVGSAFRMTAATLVDFAWEFGLGLQSLNSTLLLAVCTPTLTAVGQVGDGAVVARLPDHSLFALSQPVRAEYINETTFLTSAAGLNQMTFHVTERRILQIAVVTDGLQFVAFDLKTEDPHAPFFTPIFDFALRSDATDEALSAFLRSPRLAERTDDDVTLVVATSSG